MDSILTRDKFLIKQRSVGNRPNNNFRIYDPTGDELLMVCREEALYPAGRRIWGLEFSGPSEYSRLVFQTPTGEQVFSLTRVRKWGRVKFILLDRNGREIAALKSKIFLRGGGFEYIDPNERYAIKAMVGGLETWVVKGSIRIAVLTKPFPKKLKELGSPVSKFHLGFDDWIEKENSLRLMILGAILPIYNSIPDD